MINKIKSLFKREEFKTEEQALPEVVSTEMEIDFTEEDSDQEADDFFNSKPDFLEATIEPSRTDREEIKMHFILAAIKEMNSLSELEKEKSIQEESRRPLIVSQKKPMPISLEPPKKNIFAIDEAEKSKKYVIDNGNKNITDKMELLKIAAHKLYYKAVQAEIKWVAERIYNAIFELYTLKVDVSYIEKLAVHNKKPNMELCLNNAWLKVKHTGNGQQTDLHRKFEAFKKELESYKYRLDDLDEIFNYDEKEIKEFSLREYNKQADKKTIERKEMEELIASQKKK